MGHRGRRDTWTEQGERKEKRGGVGGMERLRGGGESLREGGQNLRIGRKCAESNC